MPSLFRIDKNSLTANKMDSSSVVKLPGFEELMEQNGDELDEEWEDIDEEQKDNIIDEKEQQIKQLEQQIAEAKGGAEKIITKAQIDTQRLTEEAAQRGYEEGYNQAAASVRQEQEQDHQRVEDAVIALMNARQEVFSQIEHSVLDLSLFLAERIIKIELEKNDEVFINIVRDTLSKVQYQNNIIVNMSKAEYERIFADDGSDIAVELKNSGVEVRQDLSLKSGECIVETEFGNINSGIRTQLKRLGYALEESQSGQ